MRVKLLVLFFFVATVATTDVPELESDEVEWRKFKKQFDKHYDFPEDDEFRYNIFKDTLKGIREHNEKYKKNEVTWTQGINQFADLTHSDFMNKYTMANWVRKNNHVGQTRQLTKSAVKTKVNWPEDVERDDLSLHHDENDLNLGTDQVEWENFKKKFNKHYTPEEDTCRFRIFKHALVGIKEHNERYKKHEVSWTQGINEFTDLTQQEFESRHNLEPLEGHEHDGEKLYTDDEEWEKFKSVYQKHYDTPAEESYRKSIFLAALKAIRHHNEKYEKNEVSWRQGVNKFSDLTQQEFERKYTSHLLTASGAVVPPPGASRAVVPPPSAAPQSVPEKLETDEVEWEKFRKTFDKHYNTPEEETYRYGVFKATLKGIKDHNEKYLRHETSYYQGINQFADLTQAEFASKYTMANWIRQRAGHVEHARTHVNMLQRTVVH